jgi:GxxExxY protein
MSESVSNQDSPDDEITARIIGAAIEVHRVLGPGLLESVYEEALCREFDLRNIPYERQAELDVVYKDHVIKGLRVDIVVESAVVVEIKSVTNLPEVALAQVLSYLRATGLNRGLLLNFGKARMSEGIKRVAN